MLQVLKVERGSPYQTILMDKKICHGFLYTEEAHLTEVTELTLVGGWENTWGNTIYA